VTQTPIAIVGLAALMPQARNLGEFWQHILRGSDCSSDVPPTRWRTEDYYDPDPTTPDKTYARRGGFLPDVEFDPLEFGLPPNVLEVIDVAQLLSLLVARDALADAGYLEAPQEVRRRTGVVLGVGGGQKLITPLTSRLQYPVWERVLAAAGVPETTRTRAIEAIKLAYPAWREDAFPGLLGNVIAGRIANRLDLGGMNCVVDAACASSLAALKMATSELAEGRSDVMISGGVDTDNSIFMYMCFSKTPAFTPDGVIRPFDADSAGMLIGEGIGMYVLKRASDAERDGDRIYAVIRGIGASSDGLHTSIYAPRSAGQALALERAYADAECAPEGIGLLEAHGTGTVAGDLAEVTTLKEVFAAAPPGAIALGSVKSQIGHTKAAAGAAGLIKAALAVSQQVLPPTINVQSPNPALGIDGSPFYVNTDTRPWLAPADGSPRRAGVSSFGFGGTNYHVVIEEPQNAQKTGTTPERLGAISQVVVLSAATPSALETRCRAAATDLAGSDGDSEFAELIGCTDPVPFDSARVGVVASTSTETARLLELAAQRLQLEPDSPAWSDPRGVHFRPRALDLTGRIAALFPGQGSQHVGMARALGCAFPPVREALSALGPEVRYVDPPPAFTAAERERQESELRRTEHAQPCIGAMSAGLYQLLHAAGFKPDYVAGHSFGELTALWAAGVVRDSDLLGLAVARGRAMAPPPNVDGGEMLAVEAGPDALRALEGVYIANENGPHQTVIAGPRVAVAAARDRLQLAGMRVTSLPVGAGFHTPLMAHAVPPFEAALDRLELRQPQVLVAANLTGDWFPADVTEIRRMLAQQLVQPVRFGLVVERLYAAGTRCFVEVGPRAILTSLVNEILGDREHLALAVQPSRRGDQVRQVQEAVLQLRVAGVHLDSIDRWARPAQPRRRKPSAATVRLNGSNYVSERTESAYEHALAELRAEPVAPVTPAPPAPVAPLDARVHATDDTLNQLASAQADAARVHQQYLAGHAEFMRSYAELARMQIQLIADGKIPSLPAGAWEAALRGTRLLEEHQATTDRTHAEYIAQQATAFELWSGLVSGSPAASVSLAPPPSVMVPATPLPVSGVSAAAPTTSPAPPVSMPSMSPHEAAPTVKPDGASLEVPVDVGEVTEALLSVVSDKTGYPVDMLELEMDVEGDLGLDSIKRVEILGAMYGLFPHLPRLKAESLGELRTLQDVVALLVDTVADSSTSVTPATQNGVAPPVLSRAVRLMPLPPPDRLEIAAPPGHVCVLTDDGTPLTSEVRGRLEAVGWPVVELDLRTCSDIDAAVASIATRHGPIGACVHLHPRVNTADPLPTVDRDLARRVFLLARAVAPALVNAADSGRAIFAVVVRLDGSLGLNGSCDFSAIAGGLFGLVKTLSLEWPEVFCRAVDVSPDVAPALAASLLEAELADPDQRITEVSHRGDGRYTLAVES
jgi:acyl transferase domain-containing protein